MVKVILISLIVNVILFLVVSEIEITQQPFGIKLENPTRGVALVLSVIYFLAIYILGGIEVSSKSTDRYIDGYKAGVDDYTDRINKKLKELGIEAKFEKNK